MVVFELMTKNYGAPQFYRGGLYVSLELAEKVVESIREDDEQRDCAYDCMESYSINPITVITGE